jgi:hypothetical protein
MKKKLLVLTLLFFLLTGCSDRAGERPPTPFPEGYLPTAVALTAAALPSPTPAPVTPTATRAPTFTPSPIPSPTQTFTPTAIPEIPLPAIRVLSPGPMSKVLSPITLKTYVQPGAGGKILVELIGEDGRLLASDLFRRETILVEGAYIKMDVPFETRAAAELGRLQISTKDEFGRPLEIYSIRLLLLSAGKYDINRSDTEYPRAVFYSPEAEEEVSGGVLHVSGEYQSYNDLPVILEILDEEGNVLGLRNLSIPAGERQVFETNIMYKTDEQVSARLLLRQGDEQFGGRIFLHSLPVILNP